MPYIEYLGITWTQFGCLAWLTWCHHSWKSCKLAPDGRFFFLSLLFVSEDSIHGEQNNWKLEVVFVGISALLINEVRKDLYGIFHLSMIDLIGRDVFVWMFPKIGVSQNGSLKMENPIKMDDLGGKPTIFGNPHLPEIWQFFEFVTVKT